MDQNERNQMSALIPVERRKRILDMLMRDHSVRVAELSALFEVSEVTIRRDLELMEEDGILSRSYGGAVIEQHLTTEKLYTQKSSTFQHEKNMIGRAAAGLLEEGETVFVGSGTTTLQVFNYLEGKKIQFITSNAGLITEEGLPEMDFILIGGNYRKLSNSFVGTTALLTLANFNAAKCIIGADGFTIKHGLTSASVDEAMFVRTMVEQTRGKVILVADHSKFSTVASAFTVNANQIDIVISDPGLDPAIKSDLENMGIAVIIAE